MRGCWDEEISDGVRLLNKVINVGAMAKNNDITTFFFMDKDLYCLKDKHNSHQLYISQSHKAMIFNTIIEHTPVVSITFSSYVFSYRCSHLSP